MTPGPATGFDHAPRTATAVPEAIPDGLLGFRLGGSEVVPLDRVAYVGRRPVAPRIVRGGPARLVRVLSPNDEVSATHIELRQAGQAVAVTDLRSSNGTRVIAPGRPTVSLRRGESLVVPPGSHVDVGDGVVLEIVEVTA